MISRPGLSISGKVVNRDGKKKNFFFECFLRLRDFLAKFCLVIFLPSLVLRILLSLSYLPSYHMAILK